MSSLSLPLPLSPRIAPRAAAFGQIVRNEARLVRRQPTNMIGSIGLPVVLMIIFGELPSFREPAAALGGLTGFDTYVPIVMVLGLTMLTLLGLPGPLVSYRELGILRRLSTTPVPPSWLLTTFTISRPARAMPSWTTTCAASSQDGGTGVVDRRRRMPSSR